MSTIDLGIGECSAGDSFAGFGEPAQLNSLAGKLFLDNQKNQKNAVAIDPNNGRVLRDPDNGFHKGMNATQQMVYLALRMLEGSSAQKSLGIKSPPKTISPATPAQIVENVRKALQSLVLRRLVKINSVDVQIVKQNGIQYVVQWTDLTSNEKNTSKFNL